MCWCMVLGLYSGGGPPEFSRLDIIHDIEDITLYDGRRAMQFDCKLNRIPGTVADMQPLNYCLRCRPTISRNIAIQIE